MKPDEILAQTRKLIREHANDDPDKWWYANRFVFARLQLDERKTKTIIKRKFMDEKKPCHYCEKPFDTNRGIHLHRVDGDKGYSEGNCALMHAECHRKYHSESSSKKDLKPGEVSILLKKSKRYDENTKGFAYWWDITPTLKESLDNYELVEFVKKDTGARCIFPPAALKDFLVPGRQTSRGEGHWGIKVLKGRENELAFEPGTKDRRESTKDGKWLFYRVVWIDDDQQT